MSGSIEWNGDEIVHALRELEAAVGDLSPALREIGEVLVESTKQRFGAGIGPDGVAWEGNSAVTIDRKGRDKPLVDDSTLMDTIEYQLFGDNSLEIGSAMEYAAMQQFGGTNDEFPWLWGDIPARPFLGISESDRDEIMDIISAHLAGSIK